MRQLVAASLMSLSTSTSTSASSTSTSASASASSSAVSAYLSSLPSVSAYAAAISRSDVWGGALECAVLSDAFGCRITAIDVESGAVFPFGSSSSPSPLTGTYCCYLLFSGVHYDSLYSSSGGGGGGGGGDTEAEAEPGRATTMFAVGDTAAREAAVAAGVAARLSGNYTSLSAFTLRCLQCGATVRGQLEANAHAKATQHTQFDEFVG